MLNRAFVLSLIIEILRKVIDRIKKPLELHNDSRVMRTFLLGKQRDL